MLQNFVLFGYGSQLGFDCYILFGLMFWIELARVNGRRNVEVTTQGMTTLCEFTI